MPITALPPAPSRADPPATFVAKADAFVAALQQLVTEMNAAVGVANITKWISGTTYAIGDVTWSPTDFQAYRRKTAGAGTTDPSADTTNWQRTEVSGSSLQAQSYTGFTTSGTAPAFTLTPSPAIAAYAANQRFRVAFHAAGTTGSNTLNVSGLGVKSLKQYDSTGAKVAGVVAAGLFDVEYDGTDFVILDPLPSPGSTTQKGVVQLATGAEAQALSDALKAITPATLAAALQGTNQSLSANGYQKLPGGLIVQWGSQANAGLGSGTITLPVTFPTVFASIAATVTTGSTGHTVKANSTSLSQFTWSVLNLTGASTGAFTWIAIGY